jgi:hypothetical protein
MSVEEVEVEVEVEVLVLTLRIQAQALAQTGLVDLVTAAKTSHYMTMQHW